MPTDSAGGEPQQLIGYRTNEEWNALLAQSAELLGTVEAIEDEDAKKAMFDALSAIDMVHREALHRLVRLFKEGVLEQVVTDPAIHTLMGMYDLLPEPEPGCQKVWDFLKPEEETDIAADPAGSPPHWSPAPVIAEPESGSVLFMRMEEGSFALANYDGKLFVFDAICGRHKKLMTGGRLDGISFICPHGPGCVYDIRNGARLGGGGVTCRPVKRDDKGRPLVGFGMPFEPQMPAF
ncbi:MAG: hypothetical protein AAGB11_12180 [Pseudomonadota bacterium]